jgi:hypothetical protein
MKLHKPLIVILLASGVFCSSALFADSNSERIPFRELSNETRVILAPYEKHWYKLSPARQQRLINKAQHADPEVRERFKQHTERLKNLSPDDRKRLHKVKKQFDKMPHHKRQELRERFENMGPEEHKAFRNKYKKFKGISAERQREIREKVRNMTLEERHQYFDELMRSEKSREP